MRASKEELTTLYIEQKKSLKEIGRLYGVSPGLVHYYLKKAGIKIRPTGRPKGKSLTKEALARQQEVKELKKEGLTNSAIGRKLGLSRQYIWLLLRKQH